MLCMEVVFRFKETCFKFVIKLSKNGWDNVITPTLNTPTVITPTLITPTIITPTLNTSTVTDSLCNSGAFSNPNTVRDFPFNLKGAWFLSQSRKFFSHAALLFLKLFSAAQQNIFLQKKILFHVDLIQMLSLISLFLRFPSYFPQNSG
jgi:hypothetical protein